MKIYKYVIIWLLNHEYTVYCYPPRPKPDHYSLPSGKSIPSLDYVDEKGNKLSTPGPYQIKIPLEINNEDSEESNELLPPKIPFEEEIINSKRGSIDQNKQGLFQKMFFQNDYLLVPLNEQPQIDPFGAWFLEDQNQYKDLTNSNSLRTRIPKDSHLFLTFPCSDRGETTYNGNCVMLVRIDENQKHFEIDVEYDDDM